MVEYDIDESRWWTMQSDSSRVVDWLDMRPSVCVPQDWVLDHLKRWGYPVREMRMHGFTPYGYLLGVRDGGGKGFVWDYVTDGVLVVKVPWKKPSHWRWFLRNAPLVEIEVVD